MTIKLTNIERLKKCRDLLALNPDDPVEEVMTVNDVIDYLDELLTLRSLRDAGDELRQQLREKDAEIERLKGYITVLNGGGPPNE